jgi:cytoskeletal protein CcmA (bactofilin family)
MFDRIFAASGVVLAMMATATPVIALVATVAAMSLIWMIASGKWVAKELRHHNAMTAAMTAAVATVAKPATSNVSNSASSPTIISSDAVIVGSLTADGDVEIASQIDGDIRCVGLLIGDSGQVNGNIFAEYVAIRGRVKGIIRARKVVLHSASHVGGDILSETFAVELGAIFEGTCQHCDDLLAIAPNNVAKLQTA